MREEDRTFIEGALPFWKELRSEEKERLLEGISLRQLPAGTVLHGGTGDCDGLFLLRHGQVRVYIVSESGKEITLYRLFDRDICIFSASCAFKNISFDVMVETVKDTEAFLIPTWLYQEFQHKSLPISEYTNQLMASRFSDVMWIMEQTLFMSFDRRLALFLIEQSNIEGGDRLSITHDTIARHMGTAREVVTRMLKYFAAEGIVELFRGGVVIKDRKKLITFS
jgi:CRP/FNR family transcriptional regulator